MKRTVLAIVAGLSTGLAYAGPEHAEHQTAGAEPIKATKSLSELFPDVKTPTLWVGSKAPKLQLAHFARGESVSEIEPGKAYVVEFWATWCGPCIAAFPHVASLQEEYGDKLTVVGVNIWERAEGAARIDMVDAFVKKHPEMKYTVAVEDGTAMADTWMKPAGRNSIPSAFIVDGDGRIAWMGHPMGLDAPLKQVLSGSYDIEAMRKQAFGELVGEAAFDKLNEAVNESDWSQAGMLASALATEAFSQNGDALNAIAWTLIENSNADAACNKLAYRIARAACEKTDWKSGMILDTYALAAFLNGDKDEAIKWEQKAIELSPAQYQDDMREQLKRFQQNG